MPLSCSDPWNIVGGKKRFIFWDDFRPVEYAHEKTIPVSLFLSLFIGKYSETQVSQSFNDGNPDVKWSHGVVFTAKQEGLWDSTRHVSAEDVRHMRNRTKEFPVLEVMPQGSLVDVTSCAPCMCRWIVQAAAAHDAAPAFIQPQPQPQGGNLEPRRLAAISGLSELLDAVKLPPATAEALFEDLEELGAVDINELEQGDWQGLSVWSTIRPLAKRRFLQHLTAQ